MDDLDTGPRVLAGAPALDRRTFPRPGSVARWFEPFHVRQAPVARGEVTAQVIAGADIVVAPAWLTHRRALEAVGESRRARAWTDAAVRLARDAVEAGVERREGAYRPVMVAGPLPDVSTVPEHATGRLLPASVTDERDTHDQAGILADTGVDLMLLEPRASFDATLRATTTAVETGRPVWVVCPLADTTDEPPFAERVAVLAASGAASVLAEVGDGSDRRLDPARHAPTIAAATTVAPLGVFVWTPPLAPGPDALDAWVGAGPSVLAIGSGADPAALAPLVEARDRRESEARERRGTERSALRDWVLDAARRAPGGRALWLGAPDIEPPPGFEWTVLDPTTDPLAALPDAAFRLVVVRTALPTEIVRALGPGGIIALETDDPDAVEHLARTGLRVQEVTEGPSGRRRVIGRREHT